MKRLALLLALAAAACSGKEQPAAGKGESGLTIFHTRCSRCHGADGRGNAVFQTPVLPASQLTVDQMAEVISKGRSKMPSFSLQLTPEEIRAVAGYIKNDLPR